MDRRWVKGGLRQINHRLLRLKQLNKMRSMLSATFSLEIKELDGLKTRRKTQVAFQLLKNEP